MDKDLRDTVLSTIEETLDAQLRAIRRLRKGEPDQATPRGRARLSQVDMAFDILAKAKTPLHIDEVIARIQSAHKVAIDRESLVSSLSKKIARGDRFVRTAPNTFGLRPEAR